MVMRGKVLVIILSVFITASGFSQSLSRLDELMATSPLLQTRNVNTDVQNFFETLHHKKEKMKNEEAFLRYAFRESSRKFFKTYKAYSQFPELFENGNYDCLTATSFLSVVLDEFEFTYEAVETNYHIFLMIETKQGRILLESTDLVNGLVTDELLIEARLKRYHENVLATAEEGKYYYQYSHNLYQSVKSNQLIGLLYFNQAIVAFNELRYKECVVALKETLRKYNTPRIAELAELVLKAVATSELPDAEKKSLIRSLIPLTQSDHLLVASR